MDSGGSDGPVSLGVDVGGTFTDVVLVADGTVTTSKVLTTEDQSDGVIRGIEVACEEAGIEAGAIDEFRHATTVGTNALIEGNGAQVELVTTEGFADVIEIGRQARPSLYDIDAGKPEPLVPPERRHEVAERATPDGIELEPAFSGDSDECHDDGGDRYFDVDALLGAFDENSESIAISFLHAYAHPENEAAIAAVLRESLDATVITSHETLAEFREYERTATTVVDAYVTPVVDGYLGRLVEAANGRGMNPPLLMQSNGGIADPSILRRHGVTAVLSGPAAGVVGASLFDRRGGTHSGDKSGGGTHSGDKSGGGTHSGGKIRCGTHAGGEKGGGTAHAPGDGVPGGIISFDMGGTSTDVGLIQEGDVGRTTESTVGGYPVHVPMVDVETVGAGGGSIAWVDAGGALRVGPNSAGSNPGPACYGRGGDGATVTDAAVVLGHLAAGTKLGEGVTIDAAAASKAVRSLGDEAGLDDERAAARGIRRVAVATMARAIRRVTLDRGFDPRQFGLVAFGGAGPMHACALADRLDVDCIAVPKATGVLSALGVLAADERHDASRTLQRPLHSIDRERIAEEYGALGEEIDPSEADVAFDRAADLRYEGQSHELTVPVPDGFDPEVVARRFHEAHERIRGFHLPDEPIDLVTLRLTVTIPREPPPVVHRGTTSEPIGQRTVHFTDRTEETPIFDWATLKAETSFTGPAIVEGGESTVVVEPGWQARVDSRGTLTLEGVS